MFVTDIVDSALLNFETPVASFLNSDHGSPQSPVDKLPASPKQLNRQYSDFLLTSYLHAPSLRLVYLPFCLEITLSHLPGPFPDTAVITTFFTQHAAIHDVVEAILDEYHVPRRVQKGTKTAKPEFILSVRNSEDHWNFIQPDLLVVNVLDQLQLQGPAYAMTLSLSPDWLAQAGTVASALSGPPVVKARPSIGSKSATGWRPSSLFGMWSASASFSHVAEEKGPEEEGDNHSDGSEQQLETEDEVGEADTLKAKKSSHSEDQTTPTLDKQTSRLSSFFDAWLPESSTQLPRSPPHRPISRIVSEPMVLTSDQRRNSFAFDTLKGRPQNPAFGQDYNSTPSSSSQSPAHDEQPLVERFEGLITDLGLQGAQADAMRALSDDRKEYLLAQHLAPAPSPLRPQQTGPLSGIRDQSGSAAAGLNWKRFSLAAVLGADSRPSSPSPEASRLTSSHSRASSISSISGLPNATSSGWTAWFAAPSFSLTGSLHDSVAVSGVETSPDAPPSATDGVVAAIIACLSAARTGSTELVRQLIALRVHLSTEKVAWIQDFVSLQGLKALESVFKSTNERQKLGKQADVDETIRVECIRCLRVLFNTEVRMRL